EQHHLDTCVDCRSEWRLVAMASALGASLASARSPETTAATVLGRLAGERTAARARRRSWMVTGLAAAAVAIIAVRMPRHPVIVPVVSTPVSPAPAPAPVPVVGGEEQTVPIPELDGLPASELESILGALDESPGASSSIDAPTFDDFDDHELERVLGAWEG
ncbi:MAG: hypothetical protein ACREL3_03045, partial [Gemmatimonadales bacterium]